MDATILLQSTWEVGNLIQQLAILEIILLYIELDGNTWKNLTVYKKWALARLKIVTNKLFVYKLYIFNIYE